MYGVAPGAGHRAARDERGRAGAVGGDAVLLVAPDRVAVEQDVADLAGVGVAGLDADAALAATGRGQRVGADVLHHGRGQGQRRAALDQDAVQVVVADVGGPVTLDRDPAHDDRAHRWCSRPPVVAPQISTTDCGTWLAVSVAWQLLVDPTGAGQPFDGDPARPGGVGDDQALGDRHLLLVGARAHLDRREHRVARLGGFRRGHRRLHRAVPGGGAVGVGVAGRAVRGHPVLPGRPGPGRGRRRGGRAAQYEHGGRRHRDDTLYC